MLRFIFIVLLLSGCSSLPNRTTTKFAEVSDPEMVEIAAACLQRMFSSLRSTPNDPIYYIRVQNADWRAVVDSTGIPALKSVIFGYRDHFWGKEGYRDKATGHRAYTLTIDLKGDRPTGAYAQAYIVFDAGTNMAGSGDLYFLEKRGGHWIVVKVERQWVA